MGFNPFSGRGLVALSTLGGSELLGEDTMSKVPVLNGLGGFESDSQKALIKKQEQLAAEAKKRAAENQQARMNALGQSMLAFNPQNQMMAQMFGPQAAFSPQQMSQMGNDPGARSREEFAAARQKALMNSPIDFETRQRTGGAIEGWTADDIKRMEENEKRKRMIAQQTTPLGPGPAPLRLPPPQAARRY
jgi:hypothetical protein